MRKFIGIENSFFSLNVQTVSDADLKIQFIVTRWPGSAHDAHIFRNSVLCASMSMGNFGNRVLVGDSGYPIKPYLITPLLNVLFCFTSLLFILCCYHHRCCYKK
jgi:hypothetical protein